jgi:hypothetical protein
MGLLQKIYMQLARQPCTRKQHDKLMTSKIYGIPIDPLVQSEQTLPSALPQMEVMFGEET